MYLNSCLFYTACQRWACCAMLACINLRLAQWEFFFVAPLRQHATHNQEISQEEQQMQNTVQNQTLVPRDLYREGLLLLVAVAKFSLSNSMAEDGHLMSKPAWLVATKLTHLQIRAFQRKSLFWVEAISLVHHYNCYHINEELTQNFNIFIWAPDFK